MCELINRHWLDTVPFFRGLTASDGAVIVHAVENGFLAKVATQLNSEVFAPMEKPPTGRLYVISKGSARYKGTARSNGFSWGALDVMLPNAPLAKQAIATTYLHVMWIDGEKLRSIARDFPASRRSMRQWTFFIGLKEYMLDNLRNASAAERAEARAYLEQRRSAATPAQVFQRAVRRLTLGRRVFARKRVEATTVAGLHAAIDTRFDGLAAAVRAIEKRLDGGVVAAAPGVGSAAATPATPATPPAHDDAGESCGAAAACWSASSRAQTEPPDSPVAALQASAQLPAAQVPAPAPASGHSFKQKKHKRSRRPPVTTSSAPAPAAAPSVADSTVQDPMEC